MPGQEGRMGGGKAGQAFGKGIYEVLPPCLPDLTTYHTIHGVRILHLHLDDGQAVVAHKDGEEVGVQDGAPLRYLARNKGKRERRKVRGRRHWSERQ